MVCDVVSSVRSYPAEYFAAAKQPSGWVPLVSCRDKEGKKEYVGTPKERCASPESQRGNSCGLVKS